MHNILLRRASTLMASLFLLVGSLVAGAWIPRVYRLAVETPRQPDLDNHPLRLIVPSGMDASCEHALITMLSVTGSSIKSEGVPLPVKGDAYSVAADGNKLYLVIQRAPTVQTDVPGLYRYDLETQRTERLCQLAELSFLGPPDIVAVAGDIYFVSHDGIAKYCVTTGELATVHKD